MPAENEFGAQLRLELENLDELIAQLADALGKAPEELQKELSKTFTKAAVDAKKIGAALNVAKTEKGYELISLAMARTANNAQKVAKSLAGSSQVNIGKAAELDKIAAGLNKVAAAHKNVQQKTIKTSLASQNVIRIIQDAPFGLFGVANNIEQLAESMGSLMRQTGSVGASLKSMFLPLVTGPMAIPFIISIITALALSWDKLAEQIDKARVALGLMTEEQLKFNKAKREIEEGKPEAKIIGDLDNVQDATAALQEFNAQMAVAVERLEAMERLADSRKIKQFVSVPGAPGGGTFVTARTEQDVQAIKALEELIELTQKDITNTETRLMQLKREEELARRPGFRAVGATDREAERIKQANEARQKMLDLEEDFRKKMADLQKKGEENRIRKLDEEFDKEAAAIRKKFGERVDLERQLIEALARSIAERRGQAVREIIAEEQKAFEQAEAKAQREEEQRIREREQRRAEVMREARRKVRDRTQQRLFGVAATEQAIAGDTTDAMLDREKEAHRVRQQMLTQQIAGVQEEMEIQGISNEEFSRLVSERDNLISERERQEVEHQDRLTKIVRAGIEKRIEIMTSVTGSVGTIFGNLATITARETEKGFEQNKGFLKAQAVAEAIAASVSAFRAVLAGGVGPGAVLQAAAASAAVLTTLMARIKQIDRAGQGGSTKAGQFGGFSVLTPSAAANRALNAEQEQRRSRTERREQRTTELGDRIDEGLAAVGQKIQDQQVILDTRTAAAAAYHGNKKNVRLQRAIS